MNDGEYDMERVRTRKAALARVLELVEGLGPLEDLALVHTHAPEEAKALGQRASYLVPEGASSLSAEVTPVIGTHIGPGVVGFIAIQARSPADSSGSGE
jgi:fatty acid-binding protein DegV